MLLQLDMKLEAENLERFRRNFHLVDESAALNQPSSIISSFAALFLRSATGSKRGKITFPHPVRPYVSDNVLVETFESGKQLSDILDKLTNKRLRRDIAGAGLDAILQMVFEDNFIHAGNPIPIPLLCSLVSTSLVRLFIFLTIFETLHLQLQQICIQAMYSFENFILIICPHLRLPLCLHLCWNSKQRRGRTTGGTCRSLMLV